jgi:anti-sigma factor RsiW
MNENDAKLKALLRHWREIEPPANFEANVRRRIRLAEAEAPPWLLWRPAFAMAVAASIVIGVTGGVLSARQTRGELQFMSAGTLAGGYERMTR